MSAKSGWTVALESKWRNSGTTPAVVLVMGVVFVVHVGLSRIIDLPPADGRYEVLLGVAYFVFGLFAAFAIENARNGLQRVNELLKAGDADMVAVYELARVFGPEDQGSIRSYIDVHLQDQIDYRLSDFDRSTPSFLALFRRVEELQPSGSRQEIAFDHMLGTCIQAGERRRQLEALVRQRVSPIEWVTLLALFVALWGLMLSANGGPVVASILGGVLMAALAGILMLLAYLDDFRWQEGSAIWLPLHNLFLSLDLIPYYPGVVVEGGRFDPPTGRIRLADYPNPYPDMRDKVVVEKDHTRRRR